MSKFSSRIVVQSSAHVVTFARTGVVVPIGHVIDLLERSPDFIYAHDDARVRLGRTYECSNTWDFRIPFAGELRELTPDSPYGPFKVKVGKHDHRHFHFLREV